MKKGKVLDYSMAAKLPGKTVRLPDDVHEEILTTVEAATGVKPVLLDFVLKAINERMEPYRETVKRKAAESTGKGKRAS